MAYPISDFVRLDLAHIEERPICAHCKKPIQSQDGVEKRFIDSERVHEDCYFDALGKITEQCPIGLPTRRG